MNQLRLFLFLPVAILAICSGCNKAGSTSPTMTATINDTAFSAIGSHVISTGAPGTLTSVTGTNLAVPGHPYPTTISINVLNAVKSYSLEQSPNEAVIEYSSAVTNGLPVRATSGQITVTKSEAHSISGTFSFSCSDSGKAITATSGQFTGTY